jgi:hypothetical protein
MENRTGQAKNAATRQDAMDGIARRDALIADIRSFLAGAELTADEGEALIAEIRIRVRQGK